MQLEFSSRLAMMLETTGNNFKSQDSSILVWIDENLEKETSTVAEDAGQLETTWQQALVLIPPLVTLSSIFLLWCCSKCQLSR